MAEARGRPVLMEMGHQIPSSDTGSDLDYLGELAVTLYPGYCGCFSQNVFHQTVIHQVLHHNCLQQLVMLPLTCQVITLVC